MFKIMSVAFKYIFIVIIYLFIYSIVRLIYLDIRGLSFLSDDTSSYLKLLTDKESLNFLIKDYYILSRNLTMGRSLNNDVVIENPYISKNHLEIYKEGSKYTLRDLNSANGTFINGKKLLGETELKDGDIINIGNIKFEFKNR